MSVGLIKISQEIDLPLRTVYNQWTQFEEYPKFMAAIKEVVQFSNSKLYWKAYFGGSVQEWKAEIYEQDPDRSIAWQSIAGITNTGRVDFFPLTDTTTLVKLEIKYLPQNIFLSAAGMLGFVQRRVKNELLHFKKHLELRGVESGAWRGEILGTIKTSKVHNNSVGKFEINYEHSY